MNFLVLNLPYKRNIIRKYSCSYLANGFLYPPIELLRTASIINQCFQEEKNVLFYDAIAEKDSNEKCLKKIKDYKPDVIITLISVDFVNFEYEFCKQLKNTCSSKLILIGYLPDLFRSKFDIADSILGNNFESSIYCACKHDYRGSSNKFIENLNNSSSKVEEFSPNLIENIDYSLFKPDLYYELFSKGKTAFTYFSFGCPFKCSFCIRTYNLNKIYYRKTEAILKELEYYKNNNFKNIRILDDNCTLNKSLLKSIYEFVSKNNLRFNFYGLSRLDLLDDESIEIIKKLNFKSLLIGIESVNSKTQDSYNKKLSINEADVNSKFEKLRKARIDISVFMMLNPLTDTQLDLKKTFSFLKRIPTHFACVSYVIPYPGTKYFEDNIEAIEFQIDNGFYFKIKHEFLKELRNAEIKFMISFYLLRLSSLLNLAKRTVKYPIQSAKIFLNFFKYLFFKDNNRDNFF